MFLVSDMERTALSRFYECALLAPVACVLSLIPIWTLRPLSHMRYFPWGPYTVGSLSTRVSSLFLTLENPFSCFQVLPCSKNTTSSKILSFLVISSDVSIYEKQEGSFLYWMSPSQWYYLIFCIKLNFCNLNSWYTFLWYTLICILIYSFLHFTSIQSFNYAQLLKF